MTFEYQKYILPMRRRYQALGLTVSGHPRKDQHRRAWPQLAGLDNASPEYHKRYYLLRKTVKKYIDNAGSAR